MYFERCIDYANIAGHSSAGYGQNAVGKNGDFLHLYAK